MKLSLYYKLLKLADILLIYGDIFFSDNVEMMPYGPDHIEAYSIRYSLYPIQCGLCHGPDFAPSTLHHLNVVCGREQIILAYSEYRMQYIPM